jgi:hypothetical protein
VNENNKRWLDALVHLREALREFEAIKRTSEGLEKATADMVDEALREPFARTWQYVRQNCSLEEIAARNL